MWKTHRQERCVTRNSRGEVYALSSIQTAPPKRPLCNPLILRYLSPSFLVSVVRNGCRQGCVPKSSVPVARNGTESTDLSRLRTAVSFCAGINRLREASATRAAAPAFLNDIRCTRSLGPCSASSTNQLHRLSESQQGGPTSQIVEDDLFCHIALTASGSNRPHGVHFQGRWFPARMRFGRDGNLHVMAE